MPPKYRIDNGDLDVIRPLSYCKEELISKFSSFKQFPIIPCNLCGSQPQLQRQAIKELLSNWEDIYPNRKSIMMNALKNISPSHLLDTDLYDFVNLNSKVSDDSHLLV